MPDLPRDVFAANAIDGIGFAAAMAHSYARDSQNFAGILAALLETSVPEITRVERKPVRLFSSETRVAQVTVDMTASNGELFELIDSGHNKPLACRRVKVVRGITLKTETLGLSKWLEALEAAIVAEAKNRESSSAAITDYLRSQGL